MSDPSIASPIGPPPSTRGRNVAIALGVAVSLLGAVLLGVTLARRGGDETTTAGATSSTVPASVGPTVPTTQPATTATSAGPTSTAVPTAPTVVAATEQKVVVLESTTGRPVRTLFD